MKKTIIYGLGERFKIIESQYFKKNNNEFNIVGITDKKKPTKEFNYRYLKLDNLTSINFDVILVTSNKYYKEIKQELVLKYLVNEKKIINLEDILSEYLSRSFHSELFNNLKGVEIGGPSIIFENTIYPKARKIDGVNFSSDTVWWQRASARNYTSKAGKVLGDIIIADATDLYQIEDEQYDFYLSSNNLEHIANPMKAVAEMLRITKNNGYILLIVPKKDTNFDHARDFTSFEHLLDDYQKNIDESDLTHLPEILSKHDYKMDIACGGKENFYERSLKNVENRCLHHHVFNTDLLIQMFAYFNRTKIIEYGELIQDYYILSKKC